MRQMEVLELVEKKGNQEQTRRCRRTSKPDGLKRGWNTKGNDGVRRSPLQRKAHQEQILPSQHLSAISNRHERAT